MLKKQAKQTRIDSNWVSLDYIDSKRLQRNTMLLTYSLQGVKGEKRRWYLLELRFT